MKQPENKRRNLKKQIDYLGQGLKKLESQDSTPEVEEQIRSLKSAIIGVEAEFAKASANVDKYAKNLKELDKIRLDNLKNSFGSEKFTEMQDLAKKAVKETAKEVKDLNKQIKELEKVDTDEARRQVEVLKTKLEDANESAKKAKSAMKEINSVTLDELISALDKVENRLTSAAKAIAPASAAAAAGLGLGIKAAMDLETAMTGVKKTTDLTEDELASMRKELEDMSLVTPVAATELMGLAENAGQLGIQKENIIGFTQTMADLGATTNLAGEEAAQTAAKFANITKMNQSDFDRFGSTIVDLGNNATTTEADIMSMSIRIAAAGSQAKMSQADILGISSAASSLGLEAEAGGTAFSKTINRITVAVATGNADLKSLAEVAGMSARDFAAAWREDAAGAFASFVEGIGGTQGQNAVVVLEELGFTQERLRDAMSRTAGAGDLFRNSIERANIAWQENTALAKEAEQRYGDSAAKLQMMKNQITLSAAAVADDLLPAFVAIAQTGADAVSWLVEMDEASGGLLGKILLFTAALYPALTIGGKLSGIAATTIKVFQGLIPVIKGTTTATTALTVAMNTNPVTAWATAIGAVVSVLGAFAITAAASADETDKLIQKSKELREEIEKSAEAFKDNMDSIANNASVAKQYSDEIHAMVEAGIADNAQKDLLISKIETLNNLMPGLNLQFDEQTKALNQARDATEDYIATIQKRLELQALEERNVELRKEEAEIEDRIAETVKKLAELQPDEGFEKGYTLWDKWFGEAKKVNELEDSLESLNADLEKQRGLLANSNGEIEDFITNTTQAESATDSLAIAQERAAQAAAQSAADTAEQTKALAEALNTLSSSTKSTVQEASKLSVAMAEQNDAAGLSLGTVMELIDAGYAAALSYDEETGAIRLNAEAVGRLYAARLEEQLLALEIQKRDLSEAYRREMFAVYDLALAELTAAEAKERFLAVSEGQNKANLDAINAQIAAIKSLQSNMTDITSGNYGTKKSASKSSKTSIADPAEERRKAELEAFKQAQADKKYLLDMGVIDEEKYYNDLRKLQQQYLADNLDERRRIDVEIKKYDDRVAVEKKDAAKDAANAARERAYADLEYNRNRLDGKAISEKEYYDRLAQLRDAYFKADSEEWRKYTLSIQKYEQEAAAETRERKLENLDYYHDMGLLKTEEYFLLLAQYRDEYFAEDNDEWRKYTLQLNQMAEQMNADSLKQYEQYLQDLETKRKDWLEERRRQIEEELALEQQRLNGLIDGINEEIAARRRLREDENLDDAVARAKKRLEAAQHELTYARDEESRTEAAKEVERAKQDLAKAEQSREDTLFYRQKEVEKAEIQTQIENAKTEAEVKKEAAESESYIKYSPVSQTAHTAAESSAVVRQQQEAVSQVVAASIATATKSIENYLTQQISGPTVTVEQNNTFNNGGALTSTWQLEQMILDILRRM